MHKSFIVCWTLLTVAACDKKAPEPKQEAAPVPVKQTGITITSGRVEKRAVTRVVQVSGTLAAPEQSNIAAEVDGKIISIHADLGDNVTKGTILANIGEEEFHWRNEEAQANLQQANANLKRFEQLAKSESVAAQELDEARTKALQARAAASLAQKKLEDTRLRAPYAGAVAKRSVSLGEYVRVGQVLFQIVALQPLKLTGEVPERYMQDLRTGQSVNVNVQAYNDRQFSGKITRISPSVNPASRAFTIEAQVENPKGVLRPGMFAQGTVQIGTDSEALIVPLSAVATYAGVNKIFIVNDQKAHEVVVEIEQQLQDGYVVIRGKDVALDAQVATSGLARLAEGVEVILK